MGVVFGVCSSSVEVTFFHFWLDTLNRTNATRAQAIVKLNRNQVRSSCGIP